jgi:hypothetical protein
LPPAGGSKYAELVTNLDLPFRAAISSMVDLSIGIVELSTTLEAILRYFFAAPVTVHSHRSFKHLLHASEKCPVDVPYLIIACAVLMLRSRVRANRTHRSVYRNRLQMLSRQHSEFIPFESDQQKPRRNILLFLGYFSDPDLKLTSIRDLDRDHFGVDVIIEWLRRSSRHPNQSLVYVNWEHASTLGDSDPDFLVFDAAFSDVSDDGSCLEGYSPKRRTPTKSIDQVLDSEVRRLALLFVDWNTAYEAACEVWRVMKEGPEFDYDELLDVIEFTFAEFLKAAIALFGQGDEDQEISDDREDV